MPELFRNNVLNWASDLDLSTWEQAVESAKLPFLAGHVALMPDAHLGYGATIGSVIPTKGAIIPGAIGVDIGCGMVAVNLGLTSNDLPERLGYLHGVIREAVPAGMGKQRLEIDNGGSDDLFTTGALPRLVIEDDKLLTRAREQYGTLGGGNHFVEISIDAETDEVWLVLHSGSRGVGNTIARYHIDKAKGLMEQYFIDVDPELSYLAANTPEFDEYIHDMRWAQRYAYMQRQKMVEHVIEGLRLFGVPVNPGKAINCHHNYCNKEHHNGKNCWITRKGAISAKPGELGIIPGSMGTSTYIVRGLGGPGSYHSASHGAGRVMSRTQARKQLDVASLEAAMDGKAWNDRQAKEVLDEHPASYKDIHQVMRDQADLVETVAVLDQVVNYKGTK